MSNETRSTPSGVVSGQGFGVLALSAITIRLASAGKVYIGILFIVGVAFWTMRNSFVPFGRPSQFVILKSCQPEMVRINTAWVDALVVNNEVGWNISDEKMVRHSVSFNYSAHTQQSLLIPKMAVAFVAFSASPIPAIGASYRPSLNRVCGQLKMLNKLGECVSGFAPTRSFLFHVWNKNQTDFPKVKWAHERPQLESRLVKCDSCSGHFKAAQTVSNLS